MKRGKIRAPFFPFFILLFLHFSLFSLSFLAAQTTPAADTAGANIPVAVMNFQGDDAALSSRSREVTIGEVEKLADFTPRPLNTAGPQPDMPPDPGLLGGLPYVLTGEYYFDTEDMQHFQLWLWNSTSGALVYTDELVAEDIEEAVGYLPPLVAWVFSKIPIQRQETAVIVPVERETAGEEVGAGEYAAVGQEAEGESGTGEKKPFPRLYLGLRAGGGLDFQSVRPYEAYGGGSGQSFGVEGGLTVEFRPWRFVSFQAEGIFVLEAVGVYRLDDEADSYTNDRYRGMYLLFPLLVKVPLDLGSFRVSPLAGAYYILPLGKSLGGATYRDTVNLPLGLMAGLDLGYPLGGGKFGEVYGSLRYGLDLGLTGVEETGLYYTRNRLIVSAGWKIEIMKRENRKEQVEKRRGKREERKEKNDEKREKIEERRRK
jgi:hypothetical protein